MTNQSQSISGLYTNEAHGLNRGLFLCAATERRQGFISAATERQQGFINAATERRQRFLPSAAPEMQNTPQIENGFQFA